MARPSWHIGPDEEVWCRSIGRGAAQCARFGEVDVRSGLKVFGIVLAFALAYTGMMAYLGRPEPVPVPARRRRQRRQPFTD